MIILVKMMIQEIANFKLVIEIIKDSGNCLTEDRDLFEDYFEFLHLLA